jgi:hypothetical protein
LRSLGDQAHLPDYFADRHVGLWNRRVQVLAQFLICSESNARCTRRITEFPSM